MLFKKTSFYVLSNFINAAIPFSIIPILTRLLNSKEYGTLGIFNIIVSLMITITGMSLHGAIFSKYFNSERVDLPDYIYNCFFILMINTTLGITASVIFFIFLQKYIEIPLFFILAPLLIAASQTIINTQLVLYQAQDAAINYSLLLITRIFFESLITVLSIYLLGLSWEGRALGQLIPSSIFALVFSFIIFKQYQLYKSKINIKIIKEILAFSLPLIPHALAGVIILMNDRFIIATLIDLASAGKYFALFQICMVVLIIADGINKAYSPWLMKKLKNINTSEKLKIVRMTYIVFLLTLITANMCALMIIEFQEYILGSDFSLPNSSIMLITNGFAFTGCYYMVVNYIFFEKKTKILAKITISVAIIHFPLAYLLIYNYGVLGASLGYMVIQFSIFILTWAYSHKVYSMPWFDLAGIMKFNHAKPL